MASLGQLTAGIAHEIKNPLNFVNNFSELSVELAGEVIEEIDKLSGIIDPKDSDYLKGILRDIESNVKKINEHGKRADSIIRGMLLHSRGKSGEMQPTDLNALLAEYVALGYHGLRATDNTFNIKIETEYDPSIGLVNVVPQDMSRVFLNLINNACYSTAQKKKELKDSYFPILRVSTQKIPDKIIIRIWDNGKGIPQTILDRIFNPFFTTKPAGSGTGLGLSISYDIIVQEHHGEVKVNSKEGEFAEFIISLPKNLQ
jgi:signal transduction histidine kinase